MSYEQRLKFYVPEQLREPAVDTTVDLANTAINNLEPDENKINLQENNSLE